MLKCTKLYSREKNIFTTLVLPWLATWAPLVLHIYLSVSGSTRSSDGLWRCQNMTDRASYDVINGLNIVHIQSKSIIELQPQMAKLGTAVFGTGFFRLCTHNDLFISSTGFCFYTHRNRGHFPLIHLLEKEELYNWTFVYFLASKVHCESNDIIMFKWPLVLWIIGHCCFLKSGTPQISWTVFMDLCNPFTWTFFLSRNLFHSLWGGWLNFDGVICLTVRNLQYNHPYCLHLTTTLCQVPSNYSKHDGHFLAATDDQFI